MATEATFEETMFQEVVDCLLQDDGDCLLQDDEPLTVWSNGCELVSDDSWVDMAPSPRSALDDADDLTLPPPSPADHFSRTACSSAAPADPSAFLDECYTQEELDGAFADPNATATAAATAAAAAGDQAPPPLPAPMLLTVRRVAPPSRKRSVDDAQLTRNRPEPTMEPRLKRRVGSWCSKEDRALEQAVQELGVGSWKRISELVPGRTHWQCSQRWQKVLQPGLVKGPWTPEEDRVLKTRVLEQNTDQVSWTAVAKHIPGRTAKQCRERYTLSLDPTISRGPWTEEEDRCIWGMHAEIGNQWAKIRQHLPNRTENQIKSRHKTLLQAFQKDKTTCWTPELEVRLNELAQQFHGDLSLIRRHLPRELKGSSPKALMRRCSLIRQS